MKQKRGILTMILAAVFSIGIMGSINPAQNAEAKRTVKIVKVQKVASKPYRATKGYMYNSAKLTKKIHNLKNYLDLKLKCNTCSTRPVLYSD